MVRISVVVEQSNFPIRAFSMIGYDAITRIGILCYKVIKNQSRLKTTLNLLFILEMIRMKQITDYTKWKELLKKGVCLREETNTTK